uniref:histidinol-phosphate transaminase n=1 Tax=Ditylum brightwellii TaxID=49249 RepID=A0A7S4VKP6_9STRA
MSLSIYKIHTAYYLQKTLAATNANTKLLFICSPGNPTARAIPHSTIIALATSPLYNGYIVVDEAYIDFSPVASTISLLSSYPNIIVLQTLSKAFGLAGIRCGFALSHPDVIQLMNNVKAPYNMNSLTTEVAINALGNVEDVLKVNVQTLLEQREVVMKELEKLDFVTKVYPSDANFVLFRLERFAQEVYKVMADGGVVTRYRGNEVHCHECIRVSIGQEHENQEFLKRLVDTYQKLSS